MHSTRTFFALFLSFMPTVAALASLPSTLICGGLGQYDSVTEFLVEGPQSLKDRQLASHPQMQFPRFYFRGDLTATFGAGPFGASTAGVFILEKVSTSTTRMQPEVKQILQKFQSPYPGNPTFEFYRRQDSSSDRFGVISFTLYRKIGLVFVSHYFNESRSLYKGNVDVFFCHKLGSGQSERDLPDKFSDTGLPLPQLMSQVLELFQAWEKSAK